MRRHWEEGADLDLDAPAIITERDLRSLRRRAGFGVLAVLLSIISIGGLAWTLYAGPEGLEQVQGVKERIMGQGSNAESAAVQAPPAQAQSQPTDSTQMQPLAADSSRTTTPPPGAYPSNNTESRRVSTQGPTQQGN